MKAFRFWILFLVALTIFVCFGFSSEGTASSTPGLIPQQHGSDIRMISRSRNLKDVSYSRSIDKDETGKVDLEDYRPIDPSPSSKASVRPGPIQHGTPLMPYIPKPSPPPGRPEHGEVP